MINPETQLRRRAVARLILAGLSAGVTCAAATTAVFENDAYRIVAESDGSLQIRPKDGSGEAIFRPEFTALVQPAPLVMVGAKSLEPIYNLTGWKVSGGPVIVDVFKAGKVVRLSKPEVAVSASSVRWNFSAEELDLRAEVVLPPGSAMVEGTV